jgi:hypothetical protein
MANKEFPGVEVPPPIGDTA